MMEPAVMTLPEVVDHQHVAEWQQSIKKELDNNCPIEVQQFISAVALKLGAFAQYGRQLVPIKGSELHLCGITHWEGQPVFSFGIYQMNVPLMQAVDHSTAMHRLFKKKGKQGLIDYLKVKTKDTSLQLLLEVLNVHVFHQERPEFIKVMNEINAAEKI